jgi:hypothetical protein
MRWRWCGSEPCRSPAGTGRHLRAGRHGAGGGAGGGRGGGEGGRGLCRRAPGCAAPSWCSASPCPAAPPSPDWPAGAGGRRGRGGVWGAGGAGAAGWWLGPRWQGGEHRRRRCWLLAAGCWLLAAGPLPPPPAPPPSRARTCCSSSDRCSCLRRRERRADSRLDSILRRGGRGGGVGLGEGSASASRRLARLLGPGFASRSRCSVPRAQQVPARPALLVLVASRLLGSHGRRSGGDGCLPQPEVRQLAERVLQRSSSSGVERCCGDGRQGVGRLQRRREAGGGGQGRKVCGQREGQACRGRGGVGWGPAAGRNTSAGGVRAAIAHLAGRRTRP